MTYESEIIGPETSLRRWVDRALCRELIDKGEAEQWWWFPEQGRGNYAKTLSVPVCMCCPVLAECRDWGLRYERHGTWGGLTEAERRAAPEPVTKRCEECGTWFDTERVTGGRQQATCSTQCHDLRRERQRTASDLRRGKNVGVLLEQGHGRIARYNAGCRCKACRRAAREHRARFSRKVVA